MSSDTEDRETYAFVPEHLRHHFCVDAFIGGDALERDAIRCARRTRSAHLVSSALADPLATAETADIVPASAKTHKATATAKAKDKAKAVAKTPVAPVPVSSTRLYSHAIEHAITSRMTFDRTLARLEAYFQEHASTLKRLETAHSAVVPAWLYDGGAKLPTLLQVQRHVVQAIESCVNDSDIYLTMFEALPSPPMSLPTPLLRFAVCSSKSSMQHRVLVSAVDGSGHALSSEPQSNQDVNSAQALSPARTRRVRNTVSFEAMAIRRELVIEDIEGYSHEQIRRFTPDTVTGPFACFPLLGSGGGDGSSATAIPIGVLALDSCRKALRLRPESMTVTDLNEFLTRKHLRDAAVELRHHKVTGQQFLMITERDLNHKPMFSNLKIATRKRLLELVHMLKRGAMAHLARPAQYFIDDPDAMRFLRDVAQSTGVFLDGYRSVHWHQVMANVTRDAVCTVYDVFDVLVRAVARALDRVERVVVWKVVQQPLVEIAVMASTHVPDDRLMPFLQWTERLIKRVVLYKEASSETDACRFVQGTISRIIASNQDTRVSAAATPLSSSPPHQDASALCETAQYIVLWSNRTVERLTWTQLRQLLPIRAMNTKHFQLTHLLERLAHRRWSADASRIATTSSSSTGKGAGAIPLTAPHAVALIIQDTSCSTHAQYVLQVDFASSSSDHANNNNQDSATDNSDVDIPHSAIALLQRAVGITEKSLACVRGREVRRLNRQLSSVRVSQAFHSIGLTPSPDALRALSEVVAHVFAEITTNLPGVEVQLAELQPDGAQLRYTFAANGSTLLDKVLDRGQGVSFRCVDTKTPLIVRSGSDDASRLRRLGRYPEPGSSAEAEFPFVFVPLVHDDCVVGVMSVNRFVDVPKGRQDEPQPEVGVLAYLESVVKPLGTAMYLKRRSHALYELQMLACEPLRSPHQLFYHACRVVKDTVVGAWKVRVVEVDCARGKTSAVYELSEAERMLAVSQDFALVAPLRLRSLELLDDTVAEHFGLESTALAAIHTRIGELTQADAADAQALAQLESDTTGRVVSGSAVSVAESEKRRLENKRVAGKYFALLLTEAQGHEDATQLNDRTISSEKYVSNALSVFLGSKTSHTSAIASLALRTTRVFLAVSSLPQFYAACEQNYITRVSETLSKLMDELHARVERSRRRAAALEAFRVTCTHEVAALQRRLAVAPAEAVSSNHKSTRTSSSSSTSASVRLTPDDELAIESVTTLQERAIALLESALALPNVYIGLLEPTLDRIRYTSASKHSVMRGKYLRRGHGVGFRVLATQAPVVVTQHDAQRAADGDGDATTSSQHARQLRYFTAEPTEQTWPFIAVPIGAVGTLSLDNLERYERLASEPQPELGVVDFLRRVAMEMHTALDIVRTASREARQTLRAQALMRILAACDDVRPHTPMYIQTVVVQEIEAALTGVDVYIGIVQPLCESICFTSASSRSGMANARVDTERSASFRVFTTQRPLVVSDLHSYLQQQDNGVIASNGKLKVLRTVSSASYAPVGPFVCVPIPFVGVLSVDTFSGAARGTYSSRVPERGVVEFLSRVANHLGEHMRTRSALVAAQRIPTLFQGNRSTLAVVFHNLLELLSTNMVAVEALYVLRFTRDPQRRELPLVAHMERTAKSPHGVEIDALKACVLGQIEHLETGADDSASARCIALPGMPEVLLAVLEPTRDVDDEDGAFASTALVLRRVRGATWMYDLELLQSLAPLVSTVISQVNIRIEAIVARRQALRALDAINRRLETLPSHEAVAALHDCTREAIERIATGLSCTATCDVYLGERTVGGDALVFTCASRESSMENVSLCLLDDANQSLATVQCLATKHPSVVHLVDTTAKNDRLLRPLSNKKCVRVHAVVALGDDRILCADSLGFDALHPTTRRLEPDVLAFFTASAAKLYDLILTTHYRRSYDDLVRLKAPGVRHPNFRRFFATLLQIVRRDLVVLHSQQVVTLASDFTGRYFTEAWHAAPTRRPLARDSASTHMCYLNQCDAHLIALGVHFESRVELPMTNLPRTLDASRSSLEPAEGPEKRGAFACACLAAMLDAHFVAPRVALCVYSHDATSCARAPIVFTPTQRQFFFALAAVAADVFTHVYRSCALYSITDELFVSLRELLSAKDGLAVRVHAIKDEAASPTGSSSTRCVVLCSSQESKFPRHTVLPDALATKVLQFAQSMTDFAVFVRKKPDASLLVGAPAQETAASASTAPSTASSSAPGDRKAQTKAPSHSFFKRPAHLFGARKANAAAPSQAHTVPAPTTPPAATPSNPSEVPLSQQPRYKFYVLVRGVSVFGQPDIFSFDVERRSMDSVKALEQVAKRWCASAQSIVDTFLKTPPRGDEAMLHPVLGPDARSDAYHVSTGSGYYLLAQLTQARERFQHQALGLQTDIRAFLTGVQATARDVMLSGRPVDSLEHKSVPSPTSHTTEPSVFAGDDQEHGTQVDTAVMALIEASMLLVGAKKDTLAKLDKHTVLKEFLRTNAVKKVAAVSPRDRKQWGQILRARAHLVQAQDELGVVLSQLSLLSTPPSPQRSAPPHTTIHSGHGKHLQSPASSPPSAMTALCALYTLHMALAAIVRYEKQLDADAARERLRVDRNATVLQCAVRMLQAKARLTHLRKLFVAARRIQCAFRQHLARRHVLFLKWTRAATKIQRAYRLKLLRRRGSRPKRLSDELLAISKQFGGLALSSTILSRGIDAASGDDNGAWRTEMDAFETFVAYIASHAGKEQLKREESVMLKRMHELTKAREKLPLDERMREDVHDLFELLDTDGRGELSRDAMRMMMTRLRIPLGADEIDDVIEMMDSDGSEAISLSEFMGWFSHEYTVLKKRSRDCGVVSRKDWQWVIERSAREALRKRYRALRLGRHAILSSERAEPVVDADINEGRQEVQDEELVVDEHQAGTRGSQSSE